MMPQTSEHLDALMPEQEHRYVLLDGAVYPAMGMAYEYELEPLARPLYFGTRHEDALEASPCLYQPAHDSQIWNDEAQWRHAGIVVSSASSFEEVFAHLQSLLSVRLPSGQLAYCRFYAPSWLPRFLESLRSEESIAFSGPIRCWLAYSDQGWKAYHLGRQGMSRRKQDEGWFQLTESHLATWRRQQLEQFINRLAEQLECEPAHTREGARAREQIGQRIEQAKGYGLHKTFELTRFVKLCERHPDATKRSDISAILDYHGKPSAERLDMMEARLHGVA
jgi:hypothetical protein